ncbi:anti-sigma factor [Actinoplanes sp. SE50]|uniref:STAS domain-containing protein n=1 Tax=unclassified Actinoplanes TaxID=2626549 RepID=UPI00023EC236|nr:MULTISPECIES: STAS domain-containing protein [unclassified Actinoplanes]AEV83005.1 Anti-sigma F factor antagonist [Actinoplanes sp. SE50/110]ATO81401.1 anti-sigma factor [Actinoplanes sp. SE50]SLL98808.1 anti-sigma factor [Actinoplanes sp. SE50/110]
MSADAIVTYRTSADGRTLHALLLAPELDVDVADELRDSLEKAVAGSPCRELALDLAEVTFIDSYALGALVGARNSAAAAGLTMVLTRPSPPVRQAIAVTGLAEVFGVEPV